MNNRINWALLVVRVVIGVVFAAHGAQKLFQYGLPGVTAGFAGMGIPLASVSAPLVTLVELLGGIALAAGIFTRIAAALIAIDMLGAIAFVHFAGGFFLPTGFEYALVLMAITVGFVISGAGEYSVDAMRQTQRRRSVRGQVRTA